MPTPRRTQKNTLEGRKNARTNAISVVPVPDGVEISTTEEKTLWRQFTAARSLELWREFDLLIIAKMVYLESRIRKHNRVLDRTGPIIENKRGTMVENPLLRVVDTLQRQQLAMIRSLSLGVSANAAAEHNRSGTSASDAQELKQLKDAGVLSLLAGGK